MTSQAIVVVIDRDLEDLIPGFLERRREDLDKLRNAAADRDIQTLRVTGHSMKGTGGGYGFDGLSEIGARIEAAAKAGDLDAMPEHLRALEDYLQRVEVRFE